MQPYKLRNGTSSGRHAPTHSTLSIDQIRCAKITSLPCGGYLKTKIMVSISSTAKKEPGNSFERTALRVETII
jgi:hypothetical protein